jgi:thioredoxin 1
MRLVYASAAWCGPCKFYGPVVTEVAQSFPTEKFDVDNRPDLKTKYNIRSVPTTILIDERGSEIARKVGAMTKEQLMQFIR